MTPKHAARSTQHAARSTIKRVLFAKRFAYHYSAPAQIFFHPFTGQQNKPAAYIRMKAISQERRAGRKVGLRLSPQFLCNHRGLKHRTAHLFQGVDELYHGAGHPLRGADESLHGENRLLRGVDEFYHGVGRLLRGTGDLLHGVDEFYHGTDRLLRGVDDLFRGANDFLHLAVQLLYFAKYSLLLGKNPHFRIKNRLFYAN